MATALENMCICGGPAYECVHCNEKRCMRDNYLSTSDEIKTCARYCPEHHEMGRMGLLQPDMNGRIVGYLPLCRCPRCFTEYRRSPGESCRKCGVGSWDYGPVFYGYEYVDGKRVRVEPRRVTF